MTDSTPGSPMDRDAARRLLDRALRRDRQGPMADADGFGTVTGECGDTVGVFVRLDGDRVDRMQYVCHGCFHTMLCAATATRLAEGRPAAEARRAVSPAHIDQLAGGLPADHQHCAVLATHAAHEAIDEALASVREPWRKLYRR